MSSGVEADIALDAAVVLSLGMNRVLGRAAGLAGRGAEALAALAAGRAEARAAALADAETFDRVLRQVVERNARIAALAETRERLGADVELPAPLDGEERPAETLTAEALTAWCAETDRALEKAERALSERLAAQVATEIFTASTGAEAGLRADTARPPAGVSASAAQDADQRRAVLDEVQRTLERVLSRLLPDVPEPERTAVAEAARLLAGAATPEEAEAALTEVRLRVQAANRRTERLREEARRAAAERDAAEQAEAERRYVLESITAAFEEMGYEVQQGFETMTAQGGEVVLSRGSWPDHSVRMRVEDAAHVRAAMVRTSPARSEEDRRLDVEREQEWCEAFEAARRRLESRGIRSAVTWRLAPGVQELPVTERTRGSGTGETRKRTGQRERRREREK